MDWQTIQTTLGLAKTVAGYKTHAAEAVEEIKMHLLSGTEISSTEAQQLLDGLANYLIGANIINLQLIDALEALSAELNRADEFLNQKARYELIATAEGDMIFRLKTEASDGEPVHFICPVCLNRDRFFSFLRDRDGAFFCQTDSTHLFQLRPTEGHSSLNQRTAWAQD